MSSINIAFFAGERSKGGEEDSICRQAQVPWKSREKKKGSWRGKRFLLY